jgi:prolyl-tRNA synthetase
MPRDKFVSEVIDLLEEIQNGLLEKARAMRESNTHEINSKVDFYDFFTPENAEKPEIHGGFALCHWNGSSEVEETVKEDLNVTIRCIPSDGQEEDGKCVISGEPSKRRVIFAKAY